MAHVRLTSGALRSHAPLAWDDYADIGLDGDGRLKTLSKTVLIEKLKSVGAKHVDDFGPEMA